MSVEIGAEPTLFPEKEYISGIFVTVPKNVSKSAVVACVQAVLGIRWAIGLYKYA
jgi:hypothetical protein